MTRRLFVLQSHDTVPIGGGLAIVLGDQGQQEILGTVGGGHVVEATISCLPAASDEVFLRRVYLDLVGLLPTPAQQAQFKADTRSDKRAKWLDGKAIRQEITQTH